MKTNANFLGLSLVILLLSACSCGKNSSSGGGTTPPPQDSVPVSGTGGLPVAFWLTNADKRQLFKKQTTALSFSSSAAVQPVITVDTTTTYQTMDGFGYCL